MSLTYTLPPPAARVAPPVTDEATRDLFGYDVMWRQDFVTTTNGDYARVGGRENLKAAVYRRLVTRPGEFRFRPDYGVGVGNYVKKAATSATLDQLKVRIVEQLSQDPRVGVVDVRVAHEVVLGTQVLKVYVKVVASGETVDFEPFTFSREAA